MPRDAQPQAEWTGVSRYRQEELRPGDLLFFGSSDKKITHTGMYIGNDRVHSRHGAHHPVIQVSNLSDPHWTKLLVATRRVK